MTEEVARGRSPGLALLALVLLLGGGAWLYGRMQTDLAAFRAFCSATHAGETWEHVQARAAEHDWSFVRQSREGAQPEEWLARVEQWTYRAGCVVELSKGRVTRTRFAELPR
ncbi:MAG: hypothetical protein ACOZQL_28605 [Myxococcota bacterium]